MELFSDKPYHIENRNCLEAFGESTDRYVDLILTDPPYCIGQFIKERGCHINTIRPNYFFGAGWDNGEYSEWEGLMNGFFEKMANVAKVGSSMILFNSVQNIGFLIELAKRYDFYYKTTGIWHKTNPMPRNMNVHFINSVEPWLYFIYKKRSGTFNNEGKVYHDFIETSVVPLTEKKLGKHPTQKPLALMEHFVKLLSNEGDVVVDPFMGGGSSGVAAIKHSRYFHGCELNTGYYKVSKTRIEDAYQNARRNLFSKF